MGCNNSKVETTTVTKNNSIENSKRNEDSISKDPDDINVLKYNLHTGINNT